MKMREKIIAILLVTYVEQREAQLIPTAMLVIPLATPVVQHVLLPTTMPTP